MKCGIGLCGHCQLGPLLVCRDGPVVNYELARPLLAIQGALIVMTKPTLAVWKFASCDGCQLTLLDCEDELLASGRPGDGSRTSWRPPAGPAGPVRPVAGRGLDHHRRPTPSASSGPRAVAVLVTIGACATAGGIQALRNFGDVAEFRSAVYASPQYIDTPGHLDADLGARAGRFRAARLPDRQAASCSR